MKQIQKTPSSYFAVTLLQKRGALRLTRVALAKKIGISVGSLWLWEIKKNFIEKKTFDKFKKIDFFTPEETARIEKEISARKVVPTSGIYLRRNKWEKQFDAFTLASMPGKATTYAGDDWKIRDGQPIKPSLVKAFFREVLQKEYRNLMILLDRSSFAVDKQYQPYRKQLLQRKEELSRKEDE